MDFREIPTPYQRPATCAYLVYFIEDYGDQPPEACNATAERDPTSARRHVPPRSAAGSHDGGSSPAATAGLPCRTFAVACLRQTGLFPPGPEVGPLGRRAAPAEYSLREPGRPCPHRALRLQPALPGVAAASARTSLRRLARPGWAARRLRRHPCRPACSFAAGIRAGRQASRSFANPPALPVLPWPRRVPSRVTASPNPRHPATLTFPRPIAPRHTTHGKGVAAGDDGWISAKYQPRTNAPRPVLTLFTL